MNKVVLALVWLPCFCAAQTVSAQAFLERLEQQVRKQVDAPASKDSDPGKVAAAIAPEKTFGAATRSVADAPAAAESPTQRGYLGIVTDDRQDRGRGVRILEVRPGSPGEKAGLRTQDLITELGGIRVRQMSDLAAIFQQVPPGGRLVFGIVRGEERKKLEATFGRHPSTTKDALEPGRLPGDGVRVPEPVPADPAGRVPDAVPAEPPSSPPSAAPMAKEASPSDRTRIEALERRVRQLEERLQQLERALSQKR